MYMYICQRVRKKTFCGFFKHVHVGGHLSMVLLPEAHEHWPCSQALSDEKEKLVSGLGTRLHEHCEPLWDVLCLLVSAIQSNSVTCICTLFWEISVHIAHGTRKGVRDSEALKSNDTHVTFSCSPLPNWSRF